MHWLRPPTGSHEPNDTAYALEIRQMVTQNKPGSISLGSQMQKVRGVYPVLPVTYGHLDFTAFHRRAMPVTAGLVLVLHVV
ncbi:MAG: hypothetical protein ACYTHJ_19500 [Planctomycetota bacterium]